MIVKLTKTEMLERRRLVGGLEPLRTDCSIEHTDGIDVDSLLEAELRGWYLDLLDKAPAAMLALEDIASQCTLKTLEPAMGNAALISPPYTCRRAVSLTLKGWERPAAIRPTDDAELCFTLQRNPYTAACAASPVAVRLADGRIAAWPPGIAITSLTAALDTGPDTYTFDESALATLPK